VAFLRAFGLGRIVGADDARPVVCAPAKGDVTNVST
jgi:hypothetical protein